MLAMKDSGRTCMMCGDGANDVGALKQAQVRFTLSLARPRDNSCYSKSQSVFFGTAVPKRARTFVARVAS